MRVVLDYIDSFKDRAHRCGLGDALVVYGMPILLFVLAVAAVVRVASATIYGR